MTSIAMKQLGALALLLTLTATFIWSSAILPLALAFRVLSNPGASAGVGVVIVSVSDVVSSTSHHVSTDEGYGAVANKIEANNTGTFLLPWDSIFPKK